MRPLPGESVTYIDEYGKKFVAKVVESFKDDSKKHGLVSIEYTRDDRSTGRVNSICHIDDQYETATEQKFVCYTSEKPKSEKKPEKKKTTSTTTKVYVSTNTSASDGITASTGTNPDVIPGFTD